jgi:hypothetical protein
MPNDPDLTLEAVKQLLWRTLRVVEGNGSYAAHLDDDSVNEAARLLAMQALSRPKEPTTVEVTKMMEVADDLARAGSLNWEDFCSALNGGRYMNALALLSAARPIIAGDGPMLAEQVQTVVKRLQADEADGYKSNLRTYVLEMLLPAIASMPAPVGVVEALEEAHNKFRYIFETSGDPHTANEANTAANKLDTTLNSLRKNK